MSTSIETQLQKSFLSGSQEEEEDGEEGSDETYKKYREIVPTLPQEKGWVNEVLVKYQGSWVSLNPALKHLLLLQQHFHPLPTDIFIATSPKSGTTWFKALVFTVVNRTRFNFSDHPLLTHGPHECVPFLDSWFISETESLKPPTIASPAAPRLFSFHMPYTSLPPSFPASGCKIVYVFRNPKDVFVSFRHFSEHLRPKDVRPLSMEEACELFCRGISRWGPFWDHVLGYWNASLESPKNVLFMRYEEMKREAVELVKKLASFLGRPFSEEEERGGVVEEIVRLCSFQSLSELEVNKTGVTQFTPEMALDNNLFFRKGEVGDWEAHLTEDMARRIDEITELKFKGTGLI